MARSTATSAGLGGRAAGGLRRDLPEQRGVSTVKIDADVGDVCGRRPGGYRPTDPLLAFLEQL